MAAQTSAVTTGPLDRPSLRHRVIVGELHQFGIALSCCLDGDLVQDTTGRRIDHSRGVGVNVGVDADDEVDHLAQIGQTVHAFSPSLDGTWFRSGTEARQDCDETHPAPLKPGGQAPDQASSSNRAGAGDHERTSRSKAQSQSFRGSRPRSPTHSPAPSGCESDPHSHSTAWGRPTYPERCNVLGPVCLPAELLRERSLPIRHASGDSRPGVASLTSCAEIKLQVLH